MTRADSEARIIAMAEKLHIKIITREEPEDDTGRKDAEVLSCKL